jgi:hypothetical protein
MFINDSGAKPMDAFVVSQNSQRPVREVLLSFSVIGLCSECASSQQLCFFSRQLGTCIMNLCYSRAPLWILEKRRTRIHPSPFRQLGVRKDYLINRQVLKLQRSCSYALGR